VPVNTHVPPSFAQTVHVPVDGGVLPPVDVVIVHVNVCDAGDEALVSGNDA